MCSGVGNVEWSVLGVKLHGSLDEGEQMGTLNWLVVYACNLGEDLTVLDGEIFQMNVFV